MSLFAALMAANGAGGVVVPPEYGSTGAWLVSGGVGISGAWRMTSASIGISQSAPLQVIYESGIADSTQVLSGGTMRISSGGTANAAELYGGGFCHFYPGGTATDLIFNSRSYATFYGSSAGALYNASGIIENGGGVNFPANLISAGVFATHTFSELEITGASCTVHSGTTGVSVTLTTGGTAKVFSAGVLSAPTVSTGGTLIVSSGGTALDVVSAGGTITVMTGGYITYA